MAGEWDSWKVRSHQCNKMVSASSLRHHLADQHEVYKQVVVAQELLRAQAGATYQVHPDLGGGLKCPVPGCVGKLRGGWMLRQHFRDLHPFDKVADLTEEYFPWCERCAMQVNPAYPRHIRMQECQTGVEQKLQRESAVRSALALCHQFLVCRNVLECIEQDDDDAQAI
jgi:hypothetical protein